MNHLTHIPDPDVRSHHIGRVFAASSRARTECMLWPGDRAAPHRAAAIAAGVVTAIAGAMAATTASAEVVAFDAQPELNSVEWRAFAEASGALISAPMEFSTHPEGALERDWFLCSHGAVIEGVCMNEVAFGSGALTGALAAPLSTGEGPLGETTFIYNAWVGAWEIVVSFRRPVVGVGIMTADHFNPFGVNAMTLELFDGLHGTGATIGAASSPSLNFQLNNRYFLGVVDTEARIRSVRLSCPNLHTDTVFIESVEVAVDPQIEDAPLASADVNLDGVIGGADLGLLMGAWGSGCVSADLDANGVVDGVDMGILLAQWNELPVGGDGGGDGGDREETLEPKPSVEPTSPAVAAASASRPARDPSHDHGGRAEESPGLGVSTASVPAGRPALRRADASMDPDALSRGVTGTRAR